MDCVEFGVLIKEKRVKNHLTQKQLAEKVCVSDKAVSKWERGICFPDINLFEDISRALDIPMEELMMQGDIIKEEQIKYQEFKKKKMILLFIWGLLGITVFLVYINLSVSVAYDVNVIFKRNIRILIVLFYVIVFLVLATYRDRRKKL